MSWEHVAWTEGKVRAPCAGCGEAFNLLAMACCACGGFICATCRAAEDEGVCNHESPLP